MAEIVAGYPEVMEAREEFLVVPPPTKPEHLAELVFLRASGSLSAEVRAVASAEEPESRGTRAQAAARIPVALTRRMGSCVGCPSMRLRTVAISLAVALVIVGTLALA